MEVNNPPNLSLMADSITNGWEGPWRLTITDLSLRLTITDPQTQNGRISLALLHDVCNTTSALYFAIIVVDKKEASSGFRR